MKYVITIIVGLVVLASGASTAAASPMKSCANTYGGDVIGARNVSCVRARDLVRTWAVRYVRDGRVNRQVFRFRCRGYNDPYEGLTITCRRPERGTVHWYVNVGR